MKQLRHRIANACYAVGRRLDAAPAVYADDPEQFGDKREFQFRGDATAITVGVHLREGSISGAFSNEHGYTYSALTVGNERECTLFLSRRTTLRLVNVLNEMLRRFDKYGERSL